MHGVLVIIQKKYSQKTILFYYSFLLKNRSINYWNEKQLLLYLVSSFSFYELSEWISIKFKKVIKGENIWLK